MKKATIIALSVFSVMSVLLIYPKTSSAFWPFTRGEVRGESTDNAKSSGIFGRIFKTETPPVAVMPKSEDMQEDEITDEKLKLAVGRKVITEAQRAEIKTRLTAIRAKRAELKAMRESFTSWLRLNNLERTKLVDLKAEATQSGMPVKRNPNGGQRQNQPVVRQQQGQQRNAR